LLSTKGLTNGIDLELVTGVVLGTWHFVLEALGRAIPVVAREVFNGWVMYAAAVSLLAVSIPNSLEQQLILA
jgi:hypothetical protein